MENLEIKLQNCYGIKELNHDFSFEKSNVNLVYAKNGSMKTSFTKVFKKIQEKNEVTIGEKIFGNEHEFEIKIDGNNIKDNDIYVIDSPNLDIEPNYSTLLVNQELNKEYTLLNKELNKGLGSLIVKLNKLSGITKDNLINTILNDFGETSLSFYEFLIKIIVDAKEFTFEGLKYKEIFGDPKVLELLKFPGFKDNIEEYYEKYYEILKKIPFFEDGKFTLDNIWKLKKSIKEERLYAKEKNGIFLNDKKFNSYEELENEIDTIMKEIESNTKLALVREKIDGGTKSVKEFDKLVKKYKDNLLLKLRDLNTFKKELWLGYFFILKNDIELLIELYNESITRIKEIQDEARGENIIWREIIEDYKNKFYLPFNDIFIENKEDVALGLKEPRLIFEHKDGEKIVHLDKKDFIGKDTLSGGEKRVLFLLFILFDIKSFEKENKKKLLVIDDIADSFDYKNKYAIVEYLKDLSDNDNFKMIILSHNFDFFRFLKKRLKLQFKKDEIEYNYSYEIINDNGNITLFKSNNDEPWKIWKNNLNFKNIIALIPFVRNLVEYGENISYDFMILTHLLHKKNNLKYNKDKKYLRVNGENKIYKGELSNPVIIRDYDEDNGDFSVKNTEEITFLDIESIFKRYLGIKSFNLSDDEKEVSIYQKIETIEIDDIQLEDKIILSMKIRLKLEDFIINKISNNNYINKISNSQTGELINKIKKGQTTYNISNETIKILDRVNIMTPENIHLNSFMYEPILDMDIIELKGLYEEVKNLS